MVVYLVYWKDVLEGIFRNEKDAYDYIDKQEFTINYYEVESWVVK